VVAHAHLVAVILCCARDILAKVLPFTCTITITFIVHGNQAAIVACFSRSFKRVAALAGCRVARADGMTLAGRLAGDSIAPSLALADASRALILNRHAIRVVARGTIRLVRVRAGPRGMVANANVVTIGEGCTSNTSAEVLPSTESVAFALVINRFPAFVVARSTQQQEGGAAIACSRVADANCMAL